MNAAVFATRLTCEDSRAEHPNRAEWRLAARTCLAEALRRAKSERRVFYSSLGIPVPSIDPLTWLQRSRVSPAVYWKGRSCLSEYASLGATATITETGVNALAAASKQAQDLLPRCLVCSGMSRAVSPRVFGGFSFDPFSSGDPLWSGFGDAVLILPEVMYVREPDGSHLFITLKVPPNSREEELLFTLDEKTARFVPQPSGSTEASLPEIQVVADNWNTAEWTHAVRTALGRIGEGVLEKVVLSRRIHVSARARIPVWLLLHRLRQGSPDCYHFGFRLTNDRSFVGASPECLFRLKGREIETECVAGTVERGADAATDRQLSKWLLASEKNRREHFYVVEDCLQCLGGMCESMSADMTPHVLSLATLQHLSTEVRGTLKTGIAVGDVLRQLHPTPAVGGTPRDTALAAIRELEPNPRGWYAGAVGWWEPDRAEFAVGIRSAVIAGSEAHVFAGAGIVSGSTPETEWHETQSKAHAFLKALQE